MSRLKKDKTPDQKPTSVITGAAGFLGSHLTDLLLSRGHKVIGLDNFVTGSVNNISHLGGNPNFKFIQQDVTEFIFLDVQPGTFTVIVQALGYKEAIAHLEQGVPLTESIALIQTRTRQFAKRQHTWFRHLEECRPVEMTGTETASQVAELVLKAARATAV